MLICEIVFFRNLEIYHYKAKFSKVFSSNRLIARKLIFLCCLLILFPINKKLDFAKFKKFYFCGATDAPI